MPLVRGFKAEAERRAGAIWSDLSIAITEPFDLTAAAASVGAKIVMADALIARKRLEQLEEVQAYAFSACTFEVHEQPVIVLNPLRSEGRQRADCAHELSHLLLRHQMRVPERMGGYVFFTGNADQEDEASWMAGALLLPRQAVLRAANAGMNVAAVAEHYRTTEEMARFRFNATGAAIQARRSRRVQKTPGATSER